MLSTLVFALVACGGTDEAPPRAAQPTTDGSPAATQCTPSGTTLQITAKNLEFDKDCLAAPADQAFTIQFFNQDPGVPHNISVFRDRSGGEALLQGEFVTGVAETTYNGPALDAGTYFFVCEVHPPMNGRFVVA